jgi:hypothetical protein
MDKAALLAATLPHDDVDLPSGAGTVRVRGMTRAEAVRVSKRIESGEFDQVDVEIAACAIGMVDPAMTEDDVRQWREVAAAADVQAVAQRISELSNLDDRAGKGPTSRSKRARN